MSQELKKVRLVFRDSFSDKEYNMELRKKDGLDDKPHDAIWYVHVLYGKRNKANTVARYPSSTEFLNYPEANKLFNKLLHKKLAKGYQIYSSNWIF